MNRTGKAQMRTWVCVIAGFCTARITSGASDLKALQAADVKLS
jgi:hypothetical protein